jgi:hypothetical protein
MRQENTAKMPEPEKIIIQVEKWQWHIMNYAVYRSEIIDVETAQLIIESISSRVPVTGFYQYSFKYQNQVYMVHTLHADFVAFITKTKQKEN